MSATISIKFDDGRVFLWDITTHAGLHAWKNVEALVGHPTKFRLPLEFDAMPTIRSCWYAAGDNHNYVISLIRDGHEAKLYQIPKGEPLCPVNEDRCDAFARFRIEDGEDRPLLAAQDAAQVLEDRVSGWGATDVE